MRGGRRAEEDLRARPSPKDPSGERSAAPVPGLRLSLLLLLGAGVQAAALAAARIHWSSDQAIVGLMARHILTGEAEPIFYYGSFYAGTVESHFLAIVFLVFGSGLAAYRLGLMILLALLSWVVYATGRRAFGSGAALAAAAYLAVPPFFFLYKGLTSDGAYVSLAILGAGMLYASIRIDEAAEKKEAITGWVALLGLLAGAGWWVLSLIGYFYVAILLWFAIVRPEVFKRLREYPVFLFFLALGSLPWWIANAGKGWPSLRVPTIAILSADGAVRGFFDFFRYGVPTLFGARPAPRYQDIFPGASFVALLIFAIPVGSAIVFAARRGLGLRREQTPSPGASQSRALLLFLLSIVSMQILVGFNRDTYVMDPRYLYPIYAPFALLAGFAFARSSRRSFRVSAAVGLVILGFNLLGVSRAPRLTAIASEPAPASLRNLVRALEEEEITDVYASYWIAYRLAFESDERIRAASFGSGAHRTDRYPPYAIRVAQSPNPAFVLWGEQTERFRIYLRLRASAAKTRRVGPYTVFWDVNRDVREEMDRLREVP